MKRELEGTEVRCWDCRQMVLVPSGRSTDPLRSDLVAGTLDVLHWQMLIPIALLAMLATGALFLRRSAPALEIAMSIVVAAGYGLIVSGFFDDDEDDEQSEPVSIVRRSIQLIATLAFGAALALPWIPRMLIPAQLALPFRLGPIVLLVFLVVALAGPVLMLLAFGRAATGPLVPSHVASIIRKHPKVVLFALALLPAGFIVAEIVVFLVCAVFGWLPYLLLQIFPDPETISKSLGIHLPAIARLGGLPHPSYVHMYGKRLAQGYTLTGGIPPSLLRPLNPITYSWQILVTDVPYMYIRAICTTVATFTVLVALALQARWLGILAKREPGLPSS